VEQSEAAVTSGELGEQPDDPPATFEDRRGQRHRMIKRGSVYAGIILVVAGAAYLVFGIGIDRILEHILNLPAWLIVFLVFLLPGLEASIFIGVVVPGEIAVFLGGVAAGRHDVSLAAVIIAACVGAVAGDQIGYWVGREYGVQLLRRVPDRILDEQRLENAQRYIRRTGAKGVILGRWTAALRALVPGMAGLSGMHYIRFAIANAIGGIGWAVAIIMIGYAAGDQWKHVQSLLGKSSSALLGVIVVAAVAVHFWRKRAERRSSRMGD
jgi:membrane-associated protein